MLIRISGIFLKRKTYLKSSNSRWAESPRPSTVHLAHLFMAVRSGLNGDPARPRPSLSLHLSSRSASISTVGSAADAQISPARASLAAPPHRSGPPDSLTCAVFHSPTPEPQPLTCGPHPVTVHRLRVRRGVGCAAARPFGRPCPRRSRAAASIKGGSPRPPLPFLRRHLASA